VFIVAADDAAAMPTSVTAGSGAAIFSAAFHRNAAAVLAVGGGASIDVWDVASGSAAPLLSLPCAAKAFSVCWGSTASPMSHNAVVAGMADKTVRIVDARSSSIVASFEAHQVALSCRSSSLYSCNHVTLLLSCRSSPLYSCTHDPALVVLLLLLLLLLLVMMVM
jgi:WD40 repeat protein